MKRALLIAGGLGVFVLGAIFLYPRPVDRAGEGASAPDAPTAAEAPERPPNRRALIPSKLPHEARAEAEDGAAEAPPPSGSVGGVSTVDEDPAATALVGLEVKSMDDGTREKLKVPNDSQIGYGVVVDRIHPDSPAAEVFLKPNDVIVRANLKKIDSKEDLSKHVGERSHTLITISRDGSLMQMVLKKPYRGK